MNVHNIGSGAVLPRAGQLQIEDFALSNYAVSPKTYLDRASALALAAASLALKNAGLSVPFDEEFGLCIGTQFGCVETMRTFESGLHEKGARGASPLLFSHSYFNSPAAILSIEWGLRGHHVPLCGPDSGWQTLECGREAIRTGHATRMLCGAVEAHSSARSNGTEKAVGGEGAIFFVLEKAAGESNWDGFWNESRAIEGHWGALTSLLQRSRT